MAKNKNTKPELIAQKLLDELNIQYSTHVKELPGTPDIVIERLKLVIFVHGCFWHKHSCQQVTENDEEIIERDAEVIRNIIEKGYRPIILWECDLTNNQIQSKNKLKYLIEKLNNYDLGATLA